MEPDDPENGVSLPLYLTRRETQVLLISVQIMMRLDGSVLMDQETRQMAEEVISQREGVAGVARADRALAAARDRLPVLQSLATALAEHSAALARSERQP
jgi:hypothetical protein